MRYNDPCHLPSRGDQREAVFFEGIGRSEVIRIKTPIAYSIALLVMLTAVGSREVSATSLSLSLSIDNPSGKHLQGLPVFFTIELKNNGLAPVDSLKGGLGLDHFHQAKRHVRYYWRILTPERKTKYAILADRVNWAWSLAGGVRDDELEPAQSRILDYCLGYGALLSKKEIPDLEEVADLFGPVFPEPGDYEVSLEMPQFGETGLESNRVQITIEAPDGGADLQAWQVLRDSTIPAYLASLPEGQPYVSGANPALAQTTDLSKIPELEHRMAGVLREVVREAPGSEYRMFTPLHLAIDLLRVQVPSEKDRTSRPDREAQLEAIGLLRRAAENPGLPRRYREVSLERLRRAADEVLKETRREERIDFPSVEATLEGESVAGPMGDLFWYRAAHRVRTAPENHEADWNALSRRFTAEQIDRLALAAAQNPAIQTALGQNPLQVDLKSHLEFSRSELSALPWRKGPNGDLRMELYPDPSGWR